MSDENLQHDLTRLARRVELDAGAIAPAEAIVGRARRRRRNQRALGGALALVVVAAAASGVVLSRPAHHDNVALGVKGGESTQPQTSRGGPVRLGPNATMRPVKSATGTTCAVVTNPATAKADAAKRGALRADPTGVSALWLPNRPTSGVCNATTTVASAATAAGLVKKLQTAEVSSGMMSCPITTLVPGRVELVFDYAAGRPWAVVTVTLGSCATAELPGGQTRVATGLPLAPLHEPAWATGKLQFNTPGTQVGHQRVNAG
jgi:hypothetical protein